MTVLTQKRPASHGNGHRAVTGVASAFTTAPVEESQNERVRGAGSQLGRGVGSLAGGSHGVYGPVGGECRNGE